MARGSAFLQTLKDDPATKELIKNLGGFAVAKAGDAATGLVGRLAGEGKPKDKKGDEADDGEDSDSDSGEDTGAEPTTPVGGAIQGVMQAKGEGKSGIWGGIKGAIKGLFKRGGSGSKRPTNIYEQILIGVPVEQAYENWKQFSDFPKFMKGPENVNVNEEEGTSSWTAKIFLNRRSWKATIVEDVENRRIKWETEAPKGTIDGVITFTPLGDNLTAMVYTLEYRPKGFFEWWGNRWRTVGGKARLDVKHFGRHVMMQQLEDEEDEENGEEEEPDEEITEDEEPGEGPVVEPEEGDDDAVDEADAAPETEPVDPGEEAEAEPDADTEPEPADEAAPEPEPVKPTRHQPRAQRRPRGESQ